MLNILLLEDDTNTREFFKKLLLEIPEVTQVLDTGSGNEAIELARLNNFNLIILDIELNEDDINGLEVAKRIYSFNQEAFMVFVTAYSRYAVDSFAVHPYDYVIKPIVVEEFINLIKEIADKVSPNPFKNSYFPIKSDGEITYLPMQDIIFIEVQNNKAIFHTRKGMYYANNSLDEISKNLTNQFLRVHRSFIANIEQIYKVRPVYDRSYDIEFWNYQHKARMSRNQFKKYQELVTIRN